MPATRVGTKYGLKRPRRYAKRQYHGYAGTPEYHAWYCMVQRCTNPNDGHYASYGGRGITVCKRWLSIENFMADMGKRPDGMTLERLNNDKGYSPSNVQWASRTAQNNNTRRNHQPILYRGKTYTVRELADKVGLKAGTLNMRIFHYGWSVSRSLATPVR